MNILIRKIISLHILLLQVACGQNSNSRYVEEILIATPVGMNFVSSDENSDLIISGKKYWIHCKVIYQNGNVVQFKRFLPEGPIDYTIEDLKADTAIYTNINVPLKHNWYINNNTLYDSTKNLSVRLIRLDETHFKEQNGRRMFVIK
jgi:hypothetical protein